MLVRLWERIVSARGKRQERAGGGNLSGMFESWESKETVSIHIDWEA